MRNSYLRDHLNYSNLGASLLELYGQLGRKLAQFGRYGGVICGECQDIVLEPVYAAGAQQRRWRDVAIVLL